MKLHETLSLLFPDHKFGDWTLCDVGEGPFIAQWARSDPAPTISQLNQARSQVEQIAIWELIKAKREHLSDTGGYKVVVAGVDKWFHSDAKSKGQQIGLVLASAAAASVPPWKTMDGTKVAMSQTLAGQIFQAGMQMEGAIFQAAETHKAAMEASADPAKYDFSSGWPAAFPG